MHLASLASLTLGHTHQDSTLTLKTLDPLPCHRLLTSSQPEPGLCMQSVRTVAETDWVHGGTATLVLQPTSPWRTPFRWQMDKSLGGAGSAGTQMSFCSGTCRRADKSSSIDVSGVIWMSWDLRPRPNSITTLNMPSTKKCMCSPEVDRLASTCQSMPVQFHQNAPPKRHC